MLNISYYYISTFWSVRSVPNMAFLFSYYPFDA